MGFSCLLGHDFGHPEHEQERERHGEEVVLTTRDVKTCRRCGTEQVLTENTAVMKRDAVPAAEAHAASTTEETVEGDDRGPTTDERSVPDSERNDGTARETRRNERIETVGPSADPNTGRATTEPSEGAETGRKGSEPEVSDGRIESESEPGDGIEPEPRIGAGTETEPEPDQKPEITDDAVILTDEPEARDPMEWPTFEDGTETGRRSTAADGGTALATGSDTAVLYCENCTSTWRPDRSSLLSGDPCPRCRSAYVDRRSE